MAERDSGSYTTEGDGSTEGEAKRDYEQLARGIIEAGIKRVGLYELEKRISKETCDYARGAVGNISNYVAMCSTDRQEYLTREQNKLVDQSLKAAKELTQSSRRYATRALLVAGASLVMAAVSAIGVYVSIHSSRDWQAKQIPLLKQIAESPEVTARMFKVERIVDGETFKILYDGEQTSVRLFGIEAPEPGDANGPPAREALRKLIDGKPIRIEFPGESKRDGLGRLLCNVYVGEMDVGAEMIRREHAVPYRPR